MISRNMVKLAWATAIAVGNIGGCKCERDVADEPKIETTPIVDVDPTAPSPTVEFPAHLRSNDATLNAFVEHALKVCARGDYDGFRQLFAAACPPRGLSDFERVWHAAKELAVADLRRGPGTRADTTSTSWSVGASRTAGVGPSGTSS